MSTALSSLPPLCGCMCTLGSLLKVPSRSIRKHRMICERAARGVDAVREGKRGVSGGPGPLPLLARNGSRPWKNSSKVERSQKIQRESSSLGTHICLSTVRMAYPQTGVLCKYLLITRLCAHSLQDSIDDELTNFIRQMSTLHCCNWVLLMRDQHRLGSVSCNAPCPLEWDHSA